MKTIKAITLILAILIVAAPLGIFPVKAANPVYYSVEPKATAPLTDIDPSIYNLETPSTPVVGEEFTVEIHLHNATLANIAAGVSGVEIIFYFGNILSYARPLGFTNKIATVGGALEGKSVIYGVDPSFYNSTDGKVETPPYDGAIKYKVAAASTSPTPWSGLDGLVVIITFEIIDQPDENLGESPVTFPLDLTFTDLVDGNVNPVAHDRKNGQLKINALPFGYPARPHIYVTPATKTGTMGETFTVSVMINTVAFWDVAGFDVKFTWDPALLSFVSLSEGNFLKQHGEETWGWNDTTVPGQVWVVLVKLENPTESSGTDTLFTVDLQVIYEAASYPPPTCALALVDTDLASWPHPERSIEPWNNYPVAVQLPYDADPVPPAVEWSHYTTNGLYTAPFIIPGPNIDVYTQYPSPYGGQGQDEHSDAFAPQMLVCLYAKVTYGGDRVTNKLVVFEIHNALDEKITIMENYTDINGIAVVCFRIPQTDLIPGGEDPAIFGWWWVIATVEVDETVVDDTLTFQVGWLIKVVSITPIGAPYSKYVDNMVFDLVIQTISEQPRLGLWTVDPFDVASYPIGEAAGSEYFNATRVAGDPHGTYDGIYNFPGITMGIPTWCRVGTGTVRAVVLTWWPRSGGTAYCPTVSSLFGITLS